MLIVVFSDMFCVFAQPPYFLYYCLPSSSRIPSLGGVFSRDLAVSEFFKTGYRYFYDKIKIGPKIQTGARPPSLTVVGIEEDGVCIDSCVEGQQHLIRARTPTAVVFPRHARQHHLVRVLV